MKRLILAAVGLGAMVGMGFYMRPATTPAVSTAETGMNATSEQSLEQPLGNEAISSKQPPQEPTTTLARPVGNSLDRTSTQPAPAPLASTDLEPVLDRAIETLVSAQTTFDQKQFAWKRLKETGKLGKAITELEQRVAQDPQTAENTVALGVAYLKQAGMVENAREKAMLAMHADQTLEAALKLDPSNWEARYTKAVGMSYWPAVLNKGQEVLEQFQMLVQQQETQPAQPQFARSYLWLGDQYQKGGQADYAAQIWQRGAVLFPENEELRGRLSSIQSRL